MRISNYIKEDVSKGNKIIEYFINIFIVINIFALFGNWASATLQQFKYVTWITGSIGFSTMILVAISGLIFKKSLGDHFSGSHIRGVKNKK